jgi:hypothetical protein
LQFTLEVAEGFDISSIEGFLMTQELKTMEKRECEWKLVQRRTKDRKGTNGQ